METTWNAHRQEQAHSDDNDAYGVALMGGPSRFSHEPPWPLGQVIYLVSVYLPIISWGL